MRVVLTQDPILVESYESFEVTFLYLDYVELQRVLFPTPFPSRGYHTMRAMWMIGESHMAMDEVEAILIYYPALTLKIESKWREMCEKFGLTLEFDRFPPPTSG